MDNNYDYREGDENDDTGDEGDRNDNSNVHIISFHIVSVLWFK